MDNTNTQQSTQTPPSIPQALSQTPPQNIPQNPSPKVSYVNNPFSLFSAKVLFFLLGALVLIAIPVLFFLFYNPAQNDEESESSQIVLTPAPTALPSPIIDITASWLVHTNRSGRYSFKYPPEYVLNENKITKNGVLMPTANTVELIASPSSLFTIQITHKSAGTITSIETYVKDKSYCVAGFPGLPMILAGTNALIYKDTSCNNTNLSAIITYKDPYVYDFIITSERNKYDSFESAINQILQSFNFLEPTTSAVLSASVSDEELNDWTEYKDSKYTFSFKHPSDWLTKVIDFPEDGTRLINIAKKDTPTTYSLSFTIRRDWDNLGLVQHEEKNFEVDGERAFKIDPPLESEKKQSQYITNVYFENEGKPVIFACVHNWNEDYLATCSNILSTVELAD